MSGRGRSKDWLEVPLPVSPGLLTWYLCIFYLASQHLLNIYWRFLRE